MKKIFFIFINIYRRSLGLILPKSCRFYPSCSQYALEAIEKFGIFKGILKISVRILRCNPLSKGGYDPV